MNSELSKDILNTQSWISKAYKIYNKLTHHHTKLHTEWQIEIAQKHLDKLINTWIMNYPEYVDIERLRKTS